MSNRSDQRLNKSRRGARSSSSARSGMGSVPVIMRFARNCEEEGKFEEPKLSAMSGALDATCSLLGLVLAPSPTAGL